jgi:hypothetical protein
VRAASPAHPPLNCRVRFTGGWDAPGSK